MFREYKSVYASTRPEADDNGERGKGASFLQEQLRYHSSPSFCPVPRPTIPTTSDAAARKVKDLIREPVSIGENSPRGDERRRAPVMHVWIHEEASSNPRDRRRTRCVHALFCSQPAASRRRRPVAAVVFHTGGMQQPRG